MVSGTQDTGGGYCLWDAQLALPAWGTGPVTSCQTSTVSLSLLFTAAHFPFSLQAAASAVQASLLRQQEELDRKAAELERKERELQNSVANLHGTGGRLGPWGTGLAREGSPSLLIPGQPQVFAELLTISERRWPWGGQYSGSQEACGAASLDIDMSAFLSAPTFFDSAGALLPRSLSYRLFRK